MKKNILLMLLIGSVLFSNAQINIPQDTVFTRTGTLWVLVGSYDVLTLENVAYDSVMYETNDHPFYIPVSQVNAWFESKAYKEPAWNTDSTIFYKPKNQKKYQIFRSGKVNVMQNVEKWQYQLRDKSESYKIWYLLNYAKDNSYGQVTLWSYIENNILPQPQLIDTTIINP